MLVLMAGCATAPRVPPGGADLPRSEVPADVRGAQIASEAIAQLGRPYRYGGRYPTGFDCSGLVYFVHAAQGISTPRTTREQYAAARPVRTSELAPGDLLFFRIAGTQVAHVAIYTGEGRFVHSPQSGRPVESRPFSDPYFQLRLLGAGRFY